MMNYKYAQVGVRRTKVSKWKASRKSLRMPIYVAMFLSAFVLVFQISEHFMITRILETLTHSGDRRTDSSQDNFNLESLNSFTKKPGKVEGGCITPLPSAQRFDCHPGVNANQSACLKRGCCWHPLQPNHPKDRVVAVPSCYFPLNYPGYTVQSNVQSKLGRNLTIVKEGKDLTPYPNSVTRLNVSVMFEDTRRLRIKIFDPSKVRWEPPIDTPRVDKRAENVDYEVKYTAAVNSTKFAITVSRKSTGSIIFESTVGNLIFADQFLQISTKMAGEFVYGLGERESNFRLSTDWGHYVMWTNGHSVRMDYNSYGAHPFYMVMEDNGKAHGVFILNNAMEVVLQPTPAATIRALGGILDFYIFLGSSPAEVVQQYQAVVGRPYMVPYWSLGFHLCRWGHPGDHNISYLNALVSRMRKLGFPYEAQWLASDYMDGFKDFTYDKTNLVGLPQFVDNLHEFGQRNVILIDPNINVNQTPGTYPPYDDLVKEDLYVKQLNGQPFIGSQLSGDAVYVDFSNPKAQDYWTNQASTFHDQLKFDGLWIDKGEPEDGHKPGSSNCVPSSNLDFPPYVPVIGLFGGTFGTGTVCPSAQQWMSTHYNIHNLFGYFESKITHQTVIEIMKERPLVLTRASFAGNGKYAAHWLGDNHSKWPEIAMSIPGVLSFALFGMPLVGPDICGFGGNATEEMCIRWMQLGAFYPFSRNHNSGGNIDQDPTAWSPKAQQYMKDVFLARYRHLPYLYTLFHRSSQYGETVARPLFFEYPLQAITYDIDKQFLLGKALLISPCLQKSANSVKAYFPRGDYYDLFNGSHVASLGQFLMLDAPLEKMNVHVVAGNILPTQLPAAKQNGWPVTTTESRKSKFGVTVALGKSQESTASGELFWDDGITVGTFEQKKFNLIQFNGTHNSIRSEPFFSNYKEEPMILGSAIVYGLSEPPKAVTANGKDVQFTFTADTKVLLILGVDLPLLEPISIDWH